jgi:diguanylate cyclase (GGDEF)-like protein
MDAKTATAPLCRDLLELIRLQPDAMLVRDRHGTLLFANHAAARLLCRLPCESGDIPAALNHLDEEPVQIYLKDLHQQDMIVEALAYPLSWQGQPAQCLRLREITEQIKQQHELEQLVYRDPLTGLYNRRGLEHALRICNATPAAQRQAISVLYIDINGLKRINDQDGHAHGDALIRETAVILQQIFHLTDIKARIGGDEFVVLLRHRRDDEIQLRLNELQKELRRRNTLPQRQASLSLSIGSVVYPAWEPLVLDRILAEADQRMYVAKHSDRSGELRYFSDAAHRQLGFEARLQA